MADPDDKSTDSGWILHTREPRFLARWWEGDRQPPAGWNVEPLIYSDLGLEISVAAWIDEPVTTAPAFDKLMSQALKSIDEWSSTTISKFFQKAPDQV